MNKIVTVNFADGKKVNVEIDGTVVRTDQSRKNRGEGTAPEPFELFLASIASCTGVYGREFCAARGISTEGMGLRMICEGDRKLQRYTKMTLELTLPRDFPDKFRGAIIRAMDLCAVKRHIVTPPEFEIRTVTGAPTGESAGG